MRPKSVSDLRTRFLSKLAYEKLLSEEEKLTHQNIIILDWDDTLICTTAF